MKIFELVEAITGIGTTSMPGPGGTISATAPTTTGAVSATGASAVSSTDPAAKLALAQQKKQREQEKQNLMKQIADLQKKLSALSSASVTTTGGV